MPSPRDRLNEVYRRLTALPRTTNSEAALIQLCETLEQVEDELSGIPKRAPPMPNMIDGRMYCPLDDFVIRREDGSILALTRGHRIEINAKGSLRIISKLTGQTEFQK